MSESAAIIKSFFVHLAQSCWHRIHYKRTERRIRLCREAT
jgi:hypothetical protein